VKQFLFLAALRVSPTSVTAGNVGVFINDELTADICSPATQSGEQQ